MFQKELKMSQTFAQILQSIPNAETRIALEMLFQLILCDSATDGHTLSSTEQGKGHAEFSTIQLDTLFKDGTAEGRLQWNIEDGTLEYGLPGGNVNLQVGQETVFKAVNKTGSNIPNGTPIFILGAQGNRPKIIPADASSITTSGVVGVTTEAIDNNATGYVTNEGLVRDVDTSGFPEGALLWLSTTAGEFTATKPTAPDRSVAVGYSIFQNETSGIILVKPTVVPGLLSLSDVLLAAPNDGDILVWNAAQSRWEAQAPA
jgi:hypothetical protein